MVNINEYGIVRDKKVEDYYWGCLSDYIDETINELIEDSYGDFDEFQTELDHYLGVITVILIDKVDLNNISFDSNRGYFKPLEDILNDEWFTKILPESWESEDTISIPCKNICTSCLQKKRLRD